MFLLVKYVNNIFVFLDGFYCLMLMLDLVRDKIHKCLRCLAIYLTWPFNIFFGPMLFINFVL